MGWAYGAILLEGLLKVGRLGQVTVHIGRLVEEDALEHVTCPLLPPPLLRVSIAVAGPSTDAAATHTNRQGRALRLASVMDARTHAHTLTHSFCVV
jgi:hypothetical protein